LFGCLIFAGMRYFIFFRLNVLLAVLSLQLNISRAQVNMHEVPVLCYHQIRNWQTTDSKFARTYIMPLENFKVQMKMLKDSGYNTITPDELLDYLNHKAALPSKSIVITFDDGTASQVLNAIPVLNQYHFKAVFFIMTVSLNHSIYMSTQQVKILNDEGFIIGAHTWDHHNVTGYKNDDWIIQLQKPKQQLEKIIGKPVEYFAYPNGAWNEAAIEQLKNYDYKAAFQLADKRSAINANYTIRRIIVDGNWNTKQFLDAIHHAFK
jgi:peptidoglycan/xylan/chitin deacetylase (PgdA/CDA1 family)